MSEWPTIPCSPYLAKQQIKLMIRCGNMFRVWVGTQCYLFPFFSFLAGSYDEDEKQLLLHFSLGTLVITGPKVSEFVNAFSSHRATLLKADGKDIVSVTMHRPPKDEELTE
jgi:hypothetical protein